jgi:hypothetical protein
MDIEGVTTQPDPHAPYLLSQAIKSGPFVFVSLLPRASKPFRTSDVH